MCHDVIKPICWLVAGLIIFVLLAVWTGNRVDWVSKEAIIEQLRADAKKVDSKMAEDVAGQVAVINQEIALNQRWRKTIVGVLCIPSGWDTVKAIEMPNVQ